MAPMTTLPQPLRRALRRRRRADTGRLTAPAVPDAPVVDIADGVEAQVLMRAGDPIFEQWRHAPNLRQSSALRILWYAGGHPRRRPAR